MNSAKRDRVVARDGLVRAGWQWKSGRLASAKGRQNRSGHAFLFRDVPFSSRPLARRERATPHERRGVRFSCERAVSGGSFRPGRRNWPIDNTYSPDGWRDPGCAPSNGKRLNVQIGRTLVGQRTLRVYGPNEVVIIKPAAERHWMGVTALEDADFVITDSVAGLTG